VKKARHGARASAILGEPIVDSAAGAHFSRCGRRRYLLWRRWDMSGPVANFLMLNPSTADEHKLDPTCARARDFAERWGFGALIVTNVFAWRASDPGVLRTVADPVGRGNDAAIVRAALQSALVVAAWGNHAAYLDRAAQVRALLRANATNVKALRLNAGGEPAHPLYLTRSLQPISYL